MKPEPGNYRRLIENLPDAFAYHQIVTDAEGTPVDYIFLEINDAFEKMTGLKRDEVIGKRVTKVLPEIGKSGFDWIGTYGQVALGGEPARFENYSEPLGRWYDVSAYSDKPDYFVTVFRDITEKIQVEKELQEREALQRLLMSLATELVNIPLERVDTAINNVLQKIGEFSGLDRVYIFKHDYSRSVTTNTHEWCAEGITPEIDNCQAIPLEQLQTMLQAHQNGEAFIVPRISNLPENDRFRKHIEKQGILSLLALPLKDEELNSGFVGFDAVREEKAFTDVEISLLKVLAKMVTNIIQKEQNEKALWESEKKYRQIVDNIYDVVWTTDLNLNLTYVSPSVEKMVEEPVDVHLKKPIEEKFPPSSLDKLSTTIKEEFEKENDPGSDKNRSRKIEVEHYRADGSTIWLEMHVSIIRDQNENIIGFQGVSRDITDRKHLEEELFALKVFHENIVQNINEGIIIYNNSGEAIFTNQTLLQMSGYEADEFIGSYWTLIVPPQYYKAVEEANARRSAGKSDRYEMAIKHKNGSLIPVQVSGSPYHDSKTGEMIGTLAVLTNMTEPKQAEDELLELKTFNESIVQNIFEGILITNNSGEITFVNPAMVQMLGYNNEEYLGKHWTFMVPLQDHQVAKEADARRREGKADRYELALYHKNGSLVPMQISGRPYYNSKTGEMGGTLALFVNLTDRLKTEAALQESEKRSKALISAIPDMLFRCNREGNYLEAVVKDETMLHAKARSLYRQNMLVGKNIAEVLPDAIAKKLMSGIIKALESGDIQVLEYAYKFKASEHILEARLAPIDTNEVVSIVRDVTERKNYEAKLQYISFHDQLTGLYNRSYYENELKRLDSSREHPIAIISADIDGVKLINDTFGHSEGDRYIQRGAELLKSTLRASDILARIGGDEFAIILPRITQEKGQKLVERIHHQIEESNRRETTSLPLSISIGLAVSESSEQSLEETYKKADKAMYVDKLQRGEKARSMIVTLLIASLSKRSELSEGERDQVQALCLQMGKVLNLDNNQISNLNLLSRTYDLGKVSLPDHIVHCNLLHKSGELTEAEREAIRRHPETGYRIASSSPELANIADLILKHHENFDGSGYPLGLKGDKIPVECRILAIAIAYSAMINPRPYAKTFKKTEAIKELQRCAGTQFDPQLVEIFTAIMKDDGGLLKPQAPG